MMKLMILPSSDPRSRSKNEHHVPLGQKPQTSAPQSDQSEVFANQTLTERASVDGMHEKLTSKRHKQRKTSNLEPWGR